MALRAGDKANFDTLVKALASGDAALVETTDNATGEYRALICAINKHGDEIEMIPLAVMVTGNPYADYTDPIAAMDAGEVVQ